MALINYTSPNVNNTAESDAIKHFAHVGKSGIFKLEGATLSFSNIGGAVIFNKGYATIQGRFFKIESGTAFTVPLDAEMYGYICINFDWETQTASIVIKEQEVTHPTLQQDNMIGNDAGMFNLPIAKYYKTLSNITFEDLDDSYYMSSYESVIASFEELENRIDYLENYCILRTAIAVGTSGSLESSSGYPGTATTNIGANRREVKIDGVDASITEYTSSTGAISVPFTTTTPNTLKRITVTFYNI